MGVMQFAVRRQIAGIAGADQHEFVRRAAQNVRDTLRQAGFGEIITCASNLSPRRWMTGA
jgi:hypothetical protein